MQNENWNKMFLTYSYEHRGNGGKIVIGCACAFQIDHHRIHSNQIQRKRAKYCLESSETIGQKYFAFGIDPTQNEITN